jgi:hypothetical protein
VRRTVATLLVVASPLLMAAPVGAQEGRRALPTVTPAAPAVQAVVAALPVTVAPPAVEAVTPAVPAPATPAAVRPVVKTVRAKALAPAVVRDDAAYAARLQADLCEARAVFCGLDRGGHYPAG